MSRNSCEYTKGGCSAPSRMTILLTSNNRLLYSRCYTVCMKETSPSRLAAGAGIILVGVAALLGAFNVINFNDIFQTYWPLLLVAAGVVVLLENPRQNYLWAILLTVFGVIAQLNTLEIVTVNFWQLFWPVILIVIGWSVLTQRVRANANSTDNVTAILSGAETKNKSKDFKGSSVSAILGGASIDLSKATIKKEATVEVLTIMGGVELRVPETWEVRTSVMPILGGVENKTAAPTKSGAPVLHVIGTAVMGGIEIKN